MDRTERYYRIDRLIRAHKCVPAARFLEELEVSLATFKRDIEYMRSRFHAPIAWHRASNGYSFASTPTGTPRYELPGLWFNASEIHALLTMLHLLRNLEPGVLAPHVEPLRGAPEEAPRERQPWRGGDRAAHSHPADDRPADENGAFRGRRHRAAPAQAAAHRIFLPRAE